MTISTKDSVYQKPLPLRKSARPTALWFSSISESPIPAAFLHDKAHSHVRACSPDKNTTGDGDPAKFQSIQEAYEILSDDASRATYDATGLLPGQKPQQQPGAGADFFDQMFGAPGRGPQPFNRSPSAPPQRRKAKSSTTALDVSLEDLFLGKTYNFSVKRVSFCKGCKGSGAKPGAAQRECYPCQGYVRGPMIFFFSAGAWASCLSFLFFFLRAKRGLKLRLHRTSFVPSGLFVKSAKAPGKPTVLQTSEFGC